MVHKCDDIKTSINVIVKFTDLERIRERCKDISPVSTYVRRLVLADLDRDDYDSMIEVIQLRKENKEFKDKVIDLRAKIGQKTSALNRANNIIERLY